MKSCTIIVGPADEWIARDHDRRPIVLQPAAFSTWMDGTAGKDALFEMPAPVPREWPA